MPPLPPRQFEHKELVTVTLPDDTQPVGHVIGWEDGRDLGPRYGGPVDGWLYLVELEGHDSLARRWVRATEEMLEAMTEQTIARSRR